MEKHLERKIKKYVKAKGLKMAKFIDQSRRGAPDRQIFGPNKTVLFIETKFGYGGPSEHQLDYQKILLGFSFPVCNVWDFNTAKERIDEVFG